MNRGSHVSDRADRMFLRMNYRPFLSIRFGFQVNVTGACALVGRPILATPWFDVDLRIIYVRSQPLVLLPDFLVQTHHAGFLVMILFCHPASVCALGARRYQCALATSVLVWF